MKQEIADRVNVLYNMISERHWDSNYVERNRNTALHVLSNIEQDIDHLVFNTGYWVGYCNGLHQDNKDKFHLYKTIPKFELQWEFCNSCLELRLRYDYNQPSKGEQYYHINDKLILKFNRYVSNLDKSFFAILSTYVNKKIISAVNNCSVIQSFELCEVCNDTCLIDLTKENRICSHCINKSQEKSRDKSGYVYFYGSTYHRMVKIGCSNNPKFRVVSFKNKYPFDMELILTIPVTDKLDSEKYYHRQFSNKKIDGEWFGLDENDIEIVKTDIYKND